MDKDVVVSKMEITTQYGAIEEKKQTHKVVFVPLYPLEPAKPLNDAQMCGSFYFLYISLAEILVFSNDSYFFVNIENMKENGNVLIIKGL